MVLTNYLPSFLSLGVLLLLPVISAAIIGFLPAKNTLLIRRFAISASSIILVYAGLFLYFFDSQVSGLQFVEHHVWNAAQGSSLSFGVDGISFPMVLLATLLVWITMLTSIQITNQTKSYYLFVLLLEAAMLGVFTAQDWSLLYIFWEATLIPLFFLIERWGGKKRELAAMNFVLYTMGGSVFMLISLLVAFDAAGLHSFAFGDLREGLKNLGEDKQILIFLGLMIGFGVKMPIFPLHGWLPLADVEAPVPISILLSGILLKMGAYGLIRAVEMLPLAALALQNLLFILALIGIVYGSVLAWRQTEMRRMIAYSSISHMGMVLLGIAGLSTVSMNGAIIQMISHGLVAASLFMLFGLLYLRTGKRYLYDYGGLIHTAPRFALFIGLALMAGLGIPGTVNFIAEVHILLAGWQTWSAWAAVVALGIMVNSVYHIRAMRYLLTGPAKFDNKPFVDLSQTEFLAISVLIALVFILGIYPDPLLQLVSTTVADFSALMHP